MTDHKIKFELSEQELVLVAQGLDLLVRNIGLSPRLTEIVVLAEKINAQADEQGE